MNQETDFFHLVTQHELALFVIFSLLILAVLFTFGFLIGKRTERKKTIGGSNERQK